MSLGAGVNGLVPTAAVGLAMLVCQPTLDRTQKAVLTTLTALVLVVLVVMLTAGLVKETCKDAILPKDAYAFLALVTNAIALPTLITLGALNLKSGNRLTGAVLVATGAASLTALIVAAIDEARIIRRTPVQMKQKSVNRLYSLLQRFQKVADATGLQYFAICGTLIGAARHGGLMQWDDDVDLGMMQEQARRLLQDVLVLKALEEHGLSVETSLFCMKVYDRTYSYPFLDIFEFRDGGASYEYSKSCSRLNWPRETIAKSHMFGPRGQLATLPYGPLTITAPFSYEKVLKAQFGNDVMTHFYTQTTHGDTFLILRNGIASKKTKLEKQHMQPLLPA